MQPVTDKDQDKSGASSRGGTTTAAATTGYSRSFWVPATAAVGGFAGTHMLMRSMPPTYPHTSSSF
jgi:hypothetical protein